VDATATNLLRTLRPPRSRSMTGMPSPPPFAEAAKPSNRSRTRGANPRQLDLPARSLSMARRHPSPYPGRKGPSAPRGRAASSIGFGSWPTLEPGEHDMRIGAEWVVANLPVGVYLRGDMPAPRPPPHSTPARRSPCTGRSARPGPACGSPGSAASIELTRRPHFSHAKTVRLNAISAKLRQEHYG
jgi:hypothetical protein